MPALRNIRLVAPFARLRGAASLGIAVCLGACYQPPSALHHLTPLAAPADCPYGNPYLEVLNPTNSSFDLFSRSSDGTRRYIGAVNPTTTRIEIAGTPLEHGKASPLVLPIGAATTDSRSMALAQRVQLTRKCDGPAK
ncbi:MAG TPA: hypothetical protein VN651_06620 [Gemmatimonadaceae bacterium]|nr:hypothetical protein [Gemmatimonadaceae bacterium]